MSALEKDAWRITFGEVKAAAEDIIEEARKGRMFILSTTRTARTRATS